MARKVFVIGITLILLLAISTPAGAISYGVPDGTEHPEVGSIVVMVEGVPHQFCSGTLIAPKKFLTASHCTIPLEDFVNGNNGIQVLVTFDPKITSGGTFYGVTAVHTNPAYLDARGYEDPGDVGLLELDGEPDDITYARLPTQGLLDDLKADHTLNDTLFTAVGYGTVRITNRTDGQGILSNDYRNRVDQGFLSLTPAWLTNSMNLATGNGGTCYGDSGGPHFIHLEGEETNIIVSVTVTGDMNCKATDKTYRVDTPAARSFLGQYVTLP